MMTDFMSDNVPLGKIAIRAKFVFHVIIEGEIDINCAIRRAIEWPHYGLARPAAGTRHSTVHDQLRLLIGFTHLLELLSPGVFRGCQNHRDEFCGFVFIRAN